MVKSLLHILVYADLIKFYLILKKLAYSVFINTKYKVQEAYENQGSYSR